VRPQPTALDNERLIAVILSAIIPGVGQLYQGRTKIGAILLVAIVVSAGLSIFLIGVPLAILTWLVAIDDAYTRKLDEYLG